jgi:hypothetical protein
VILDKIKDQFCSSISVSDAMVLKFNDGNGGDMVGFVTKEKLG